MAHLASPVLRELPWHADSLLSRRSWLAKADSDTDIKSRKTLLKEFHDQTDIGLDEGVAEGAVRGRHEIAHLFGDGADFFNNFGAFHGLLDSLNDSLAHLASPVFGGHLWNAGDFLDGRSWLAKADSDTDVKSAEALVEEFDDEADVGLDEGVAEGAVWGRHEVTELFDDSGNFFNNLGAFHGFLDGLDDSFAHLAGPVFTDDLWDAELLGFGNLAEADLGADVEFFESLFDPFHDLRDVGLDDGVAEGGIRGWESLACSGNKCSNFFFNGSAFHGLLDGGDDLGAEVADCVLIVDGKLDGWPDLRARDACGECEQKNPHQLSDDR